MQIWLNISFANIFSVQLIRLFSPFLDFPLSLSYFKFKFLNPLLWGTVDCHSLYCNVLELSFHGTQVIPVTLTRKRKFKMSKMNHHIPVFPVTHCPKTVKWVSSVEFAGEVVYRKEKVYCLQRLFSVWGRWMSKVFDIQGQGFRSLAPTKCQVGMEAHFWSNLESWAQGAR